MKLKELKYILCSREWIQTAIIYDCKKNKDVDKGFNEYIMQE